MAYTTINKHTDYFNTVLYTGNGATATAGTSARSITGVGFQPDLTWVKARTNGGTAYMSNSLHDVVRGVPKTLESNSNAGQNDVVTGYSSGGIGAFTNDGFNIYSGTTTSSNNYNGNNSTYVAWNWKAGGAGSANTVGTINSTVSANTTAGFSIVKYTGNGVSGATVGHGLGVAPKIVLIKKTSSSDSWSMLNTNINLNYYLKLEGTDAQVNDALFNNTAPSTTVFTVDSDGQVNGNGNEFIAYCFAEKPGYSKFGSYSGNNNADGTFVYTGFKPAFLMIKYTGSGQNWIIIDNKRPAYNLISAGDSQNLRPNTNDAEVTSNGIDLLSNGFKCRSSDGDSNGYSTDYIYMAFGQSIVGTNNVPCTAR